jgi:3-hydroxyisobutyrate dehydrogenase-like beta-hydroxyacid dehydrogenase
VASRKVSAGIVTVARDIRAEAQALAVRNGAAPSTSAADLARTCDTVIAGRRRG